jgi:hypothetical protein
MIHIHWYKNDGTERIAITVGMATIGADKTIKKCRCGAYRIRIKGGW